MSLRVKRSLVGATATLALLMTPMVANAAGNGTETGTATTEGQPTVSEKTPEKSATPETKTTPESPTATTETPEPQAPAGNSEDTVTLNLYNLTDIHGHIEQVKKRKSDVVAEAGVASVACYMNKARQADPNSALTLLGDNIGASPYTSGVLYDNPTIAALNLLKPIASTIGNHELDLGQDAFRARIDGTSALVNGKKVDFTKVDFPYLGANVDGFGKYLKPYQIWTSPSGVKVAYIGAIAQDVPYKLSPGTTKGLTFNDPIPVINNLAKKLKDSGKADVVIAMLDDDVKNNYPKMGSYVDGLMGGDTHVPYSFTWVKGADGNYLSADASGSYTDNLANLQVVYNTKTKKVVSSKVIMIPAAKVAECGQDPAVAALVEKASAAAKEAGNEVIVNNLAGDYNRGIFGDKGPGSNRGTESTLGDLVADAMRGSILDENQKPVDIGVINAGGLRADLIPNDKVVTYRDTYEVMPFSNQLGYVKITGAKFKEALEQQWKTNLNTQNSRPMLKLGLSENVKYTYDPTLPFGQRITSVIIDGKPLDMAKLYTVGSVTFLLDGGDGFTALTSNGKAKTNGVLDRDAFNQYLRENSAKLHPAMVKRSIGVFGLAYEKMQTLDSKLQVKLRGLSFTEGPGRPDQVTVHLGKNQVTAKVNNDLADSNANNESAIITTDGAGQAVADFEVAALCKSLGSSKGTLPLSVSFDKDGKTYQYLVDGQLMLNLDCARGAETSPKEPTKPSQPGTSPKQPISGTPVSGHAPGSGHGSVPGKGNLAETGSDATSLLTLTGILLLAGAGAYGISRRKRVA
ncbi:bifunctional metallophosphatase/5'-nucleotidase [Boudabousia liubingyangii]|uniref:bifunctional metallophosphatase/5'-nucleotidase n=1 Tax=Boudabousia liubingyangii TaxID=1921764 RepID=UPI000AF4C25B|nr:bifunctional UDP-sugar hydrolase/5'-nucleotidase [Boudabousia liubingyangii]